MAKEILCAYGVDVDAVAGWLGSYGGEDSPDDISRGLFAGEVGTPRLLKLFEKYDLKTTWFIPGHSIETFPEQTKMVVEAGHEIGMHGYTHENPISMTPEQEEAVLLKCIGLIEEVCGRRPTGYVAPWWEFSNVTNELLLKHGIKYDHCLMHKDFHAVLRPRRRLLDEDRLLEAGREWMKPLVRGQETDLIEIPASWYLDDLPPMMFIKAAPNSHGFVNPRDIEQLWRDQFDWVYREHDYAVFAMTIHPDVSGRPQVLLMLERIIEHINRHDGIRWATFDEIADDFLKLKIPANHNVADGRAGKTDAHAGNPACPAGHRSEAVASHHRGVRSPRQRPRSRPSVKTRSRSVPRTAGPHNHRHSRGSAPEDSSGATAPVNDAQPRLRRRRPMRERATAGSPRVS